MCNKLRFGLSDFANRIFGTNVDGQFLHVKFLNIQYGSHMELSLYLFFPFSLYAFPMGKTFKWIFESLVLLLVLKNMWNINERFGMLFTLCLCLVASQYTWPSRKVHVWFSSQTRKFMFFLEKTKTTTSQTWSLILTSICFRNILNFVWKWIKFLTKRRLAVSKVTQTNQEVV